mgnify:CR=1 FL=1
MSGTLYPPIHPGEVLMEDFIKGFGITQNKLAVGIGVAPPRAHENVLGEARCDCPR